MKQNAAIWDRALRALGAIAMLLCSVLAPLPLYIRVFALGLGGAYLLGTALVGSCLGYKLMGISTCPLDPKSRAS